MAAPPLAPEQSPDFFHRNELAELYADAALDTSVGVNSGLFLAAPRRTGKSTFVRQDLMPALRRRDIEVLYIDLWADKTQDPAALMSDAIRAELKKEKGAIAKLTARAGLAKFTVGALGTGLSFDLSQVGLSANATLTDALSALANANGKRIVIVIDEAQHALTSEAGSNALFALKAARDALNLAGKGLQIIGTGSNRDKLSLLVQQREQAFFGADLVNFPLLGLDYCEWLCRRQKLPLDPQRVYALFQEAGSRPEMIAPVLRSLRLEPPAAGEDINEAFAQRVRQRIVQWRQSFLTDFGQLPPLQQALLREIAADSLLDDSARRDGMFSEAMKARLKRRMEAEGQDTGSLTKEDASVASAIQNALNSLREKNFLWRARRGAYWPEDEQHVRWLVGEQGAGGAEA